MKTFLLWGAVGAGIAVMTDLIAGEKVDPLTTILSGAVLGGVAAGSYYFAGPEVGTWIIPVLVGSTAVATGPKIKKLITGAPDAPDAGGA